MELIREQQEGKRLNKFLTLLLMSEYETDDKNRKITMYYKGSRIATVEIHDEHLYKELKQLIRVKRP